MRKVESATVRPFLAGNPARLQNSETDGVRYRLHGNTIARHVPGGLVLETAGWETRTTASRLRAVLALFRPDVRCGSVKGSLGLEFPTRFENGQGQDYRRVEFPGEGSGLFVSSDILDARDGETVGTVETAGAL